MSKKGSLTLLILFSAGLLASNVAARAEKVRPAPAQVFFGEPEPGLDALRLLHFGQGLEPLALNGLEKIDKAPAPPLTALVVSYVGSSNIGWEAISSGQLSTAFDHGGVQLRVITDELGYGSNPVAKMLGAVLPSSANYTTQAICADAAGNLVLPCSAGQTVVGWRKYWNVDGKQSGNFTYQNTSTNFPFNTLSTAINIR